MLRKMAIGVLSVAAGTAIAQESTGSAGAGRVEVTAAPIGGLFFMPSSSDVEPKFRNYGLGGSVAGNINRWVGIEGDVAFAIGMRQDVTFNGALLADQKTPNMLTSSGNVIVNPWGSDRRVVPYLAGGGGALTMFNAADVENLGVTSNETYFTSNIGGGVRWFASSNWGAAWRLSPHLDQEQGRGTGVLRPGKPEGPPDRGQHRVHLLTGPGNQT